MLFVMLVLAKSLVTGRGLAWARALLSSRSPRLRDPPAYHHHPRRHRRHRHRHQRRASSFLWRHVVNLTV